MRLRSIHSLRAVASLGVLAFHAAGFVAGYGSGALPQDIARIGEAGVDLFFVISGVVLTIATRHARGVGAFAVARLLRVGLPYWAVTIALVGAAWVMPALLRQQPWSGADILLSLSFVPSLPREGTLLPILQPGWSLSLEMLFYACLGLLIPVAPPRRSLLVGLLITALVLVGAIAAPQEGLLRFYTNPILLEFVAGLALAELFLSDVKVGRSAALVALGLGIVGFGLAAWHPPASFSDERAFVYGLPAVLLVGGLLFLERGAAFPALRPLLIGGDISYSLFLVHIVPAAALAKLAAPRLAGLGLAGDLGTFGVIVGAALALAAVFHWLVERPAVMLATRFGGSRTGRQGSARRHPAREITRGLGADRGALGSQLLSGGRKIATIERESIDHVA